MAETRICLSQKSGGRGPGSPGWWESDEVVTGTPGPDIQGYHLVSGLGSS